MSDKTLTEEELKNLDKIVLFHGTYTEIIDSVLSDGLLPWGEVGGHNWASDADMFGFYTPRKDCVYLAFMFERASSYANYHTEDRGKKGAVVLELEIDTSELTADEDSRKQDWIQSILASGTCAHRGRISPANIKKVYNSQGNAIYSIN